MLDKKTAFLVIIILAINAAFSFASDRAADFGPLKSRLIADGVDSLTVETYFADNRFELMRTVLKINIKQPDSKSIYEDMKTDKSVNRTASFLDKNRAVFDSLLLDSPVDAEVVAAILRVESNLGLYKGKYPLMNVFASLTLLDSDQLETLVPDFWTKVLIDSDPAEENEIRANVDKKRRRKANWAYKELLLLLEMAENKQIDPLQVKGSWAGAFGLAQFLPTSYQAYAIDGNGDGYVDLYHLNDAVASIANYLKRHGYKKDNYNKQFKAVRAYNHSDDYVDAVLTIAKRLKS